jgi:hypothetical protein
MALHFTPGAIPPSRAGRQMPGIAPHGPEAETTRILRGMESGSLIL